MILLFGLFLLLSAIYLTEAIDTIFVTEKIIGVGNEGYHLHILVVSGICGPYEICLCDRLADTSFAVNGYRTYQSCLIHILTGSLCIAGNYIGTCAEAVLGISHIFYGNRS